MNKDDLIFNSKHIWHPYDSIKNPLPCYPIISAKGIYLTLNNGKKLIDGMSSWWATIHGYNHPRLNQALKNQINRVSHIMFGGIIHPPAISLCKKLISMTHKKLQYVFLADSGSVAIEIAMKMALQYWAKEDSEKKNFLTIKSGYHGDTFSAMSISDPKNSIHRLYRKYLPLHLFAESPKSKFGEKWKKGDIDSFENLIKKNFKKIAAVILEPIVQGAGGMKFYHSKYLKKVKLLCKNYKIPLILDEIATGFGRTGKLFAYEHSKIFPDILCLGKAITGGTLTLSAVLTTKKISEKISNNYPGYLMHGPTFMANPLACAVASENLSILKENIWKKQVSKIYRILSKYLFPIRNHYMVHDIRILGAIAVVECKKEINIKKIQYFFVKNGVWIRPFKKLIYIMPAYIIDKKSLKKIIELIIQSLNYKKFFI
ncbi:adenosylmethionine--8-amino-7-oxononanoate transaminase [Buchnera aphidicola (Mindarus keteleerifoliae)]|uniref:adenosylmethionine--8-amino-7-oxononanoate transaminase n=1 Tax=Buchnera aphidicola TaxID=9 RepID=UPI0031B6A813